MPADSLPERAGVGVVGAGITGLALTRELGDEAVTFEAANEPGGVIRTREVEGRVLDLGPQRTRLSEAVREVVADVGLSEAVVAAPEDLPLYVLHDGELGRAPLSPRAALGTGLLSVRGKLRVLLEPLTGPPRDGESVATFLRRSLGREAADRVAAPLYAGLYGSDPWGPGDRRRPRNGSGLPAGTFTHDVRPLLLNAPVAAAFPVSVSLRSNPVRLNLSYRFAERRMPKINGTTARVDPRVGRPLSRR